MSGVAPIDSNGLWQQPQQGAVATGTVQAAASNNSGGGPRAIAPSAQPAGPERSRSVWPGPTPSQRPGLGPNLFPEPLRGATPRTGTAFQVNSDGDSVQLGSRSDQLIDAEQKELQELKARDAEVRAHEQAHVAAAGALYRGGPNYTYQTGPDGNKYAVGGSVQIDTSEGRTPEETIAKAQQIRAAAMAPAEPSSQDRQIAAQAARMEADARAEMAAEQATGEEDGSAGVAGLAGSASAEDAPSIMDSPVAAQPSTNGAMAFVRNGQATSTGLDVLA